MIDNQNKNDLEQNYQVLLAEFINLKETLRNSEKLVSEYRQIVENANSAIIKITLDCRIDYANPFARGLFQFDSENFDPVVVFKSVLPQGSTTPESIATTLQSVTRGMVKFSQHETHFSRPNKKSCWIAWSNEVLKDDTGAPTGLICIGTDVTQRKITEEALKESEYNLLKAQEIAKIGTWARELDTDNIHCSGYFFSIFGIHPVTSYKLLLEQFNQIVHPEYRDFIRKKIDRAIAKGTTEQFMYKITDFSGKTRWVLEEVSLLGDIYKKKQLIIGTVRDITDQKKAEDKLHEYLLIVSSSSELMSLITPDYRYINVNQAYLDAYQKTKDQIEGQTVAEMFGEDIFSDVIKPHLDRCLLGENISDHYWFTFPGGEPRYMHVKYNPVREIDGTISGVTVSSRDITELKNVEDQLKIFKLFASESGIGFGMADMNGKVTYVNSTLCKMAGFDSPSDIIGLDISDTYLKNYLKKIRHEIMPTIREKGQWTGEIDLKRKNGEVVHTIENFFLINDDYGKPMSFAMTVTDISDRKKAEQALQHSEHNFRSIFTNAAIGIDVVDEDGNFIQVNEALANMVGYSAQELSDMNIYAITYKEDIDLSKSPLKELFSGKQQTYRLEKRYQRKNGTIFWADLSVTPYYDVVNQRKLAIGTIIDISHSKMLQKELEHSREEAIKANKAKSEFLANMSHEIRTPLNAVIGFTELLESIVEDPRQINYLESIKSGGKNLLMLINDILDLSKIEAGKMEFKYEPVNPYTLIGEIRQIFSLKIKEKDLSFIVEVDDEIPESLILDEVRVRQVIFNLIGNAIKFTESGYVKFSVKKIFSSEDTSRINLTVAVEDSGIGIPKDQHTRIFDAFQQQSGQSTRKYGGTGLGLTISKRLVEMMGGEIHLQSTPGIGSTFTFILRNVAIGASYHLPHHDDDEPDLENIEFDPARIMIVDDIESNRKLIYENFASASIEVLQAEDGQKAVSMAGQFKPDLIFMDIRMPVMDGFEAAKIIKTRKATRHIKIVALTASIRNEEHENDYKKYFDSYLRKPVLRLELYKEMMKFLSFKVKKSQNEVIEKKTASASVIRKYELGSRQTNELINLIEGDLKAKWDEAMLYQMSDEIETFARKLKSTGEQYQIDELVKYGDDLFLYVDNFDLEKMDKSLKMYPKFTKELKKRLSAC